MVENNMTGITHRNVEANGIRIHLAEAGSGPLVILCHGFPETWHSWRHQLRALSDAGYHVVAPDMRGYGERTARTKSKSTRCSILSETWSASSTGSAPTRR
jgi:pimeloyl-ACP methyl ester carboxylesterase